MADKVDEMMIKIKIFNWVRNRIEKPHLSGLSRCVWCMNGSVQFVLLCTKGGREGQYIPFGGRVCTAG